MSESNFIIITGKYCRLTGASIVPENIYSYYKSDDLLVYESVENYMQQKYLIYTSEPDVFDNVLLFSTLFKLNKASESFKDKYSTFIEKIKHSFLENILDSTTINFADNESNTKLNFFYEENKKIFKTFNRFKLLAINLSDNKFTHSGFKNNSLAVWFIRKMEEYDIANYELCELTYSKRCGLFS